VDKAEGGSTISGDLYRFLNLPWFHPPRLRVPDIKRLPLIPPLSFPLDIPIYPRDRYHSYLKGINVVKSPVISRGPCVLVLTMEEFEYTQPQAGSFNGTFPDTPTRTIKLVLSPEIPPAGFISSYFEGKLYEDGVEKGSFTMGWVSSYFRKATLEIDTLKGAVAPKPVPALSGTGQEDFRTIFATADWDLKVIYDQKAVPVPAGVDPNSCWSSANLHALMQSVRKPTTNLDQEWRLHLVVVPAKMGCGRGVMYDTIDVPREGVASFSDDGYPSTDSSFFGAAENKKQREVPRAFIRSAAHEVGHGFNQQHQGLTFFGEPGADNSIMTVTPNVANVLAGPATGDPGVFPDDIALEANDHVRHHLIHFPDPVVRPGGMTFGTGHSTAVPEADDEDRYFFAPEEMELRLVPKTGRVTLGEPLPLTFELVNNSKEAITTPNDIRIEAQHAQISVVDPNGDSIPMPSFVIETDAVSNQELAPGKRLTASTTLFWSSNGFAFKMPGKHRVEITIRWNEQGIPFGAKSDADIWVDYPVSEADNEVASLLLNPEVGKFIALGGGAVHLKEALACIEKAISKHGSHPACKCLKEFEGHKHSRHKKGRKP
jgi:hypothetical protein